MLNHVWHKETLKAIISVTLHLNWTNTELKERKENLSLYPSLSLSNVFLLFLELNIKSLKKKNRKFVEGNILFYFFVKKQILGIV